jgi:hypothetical protein
MKDPMIELEDWLEKRPRLWSLYVRFNFCKGAYADGTPKKDGLLFRIFSKIFYLDCSCCAASRGLLIGFASGVAICLIL